MNKVMGLFKFKDRRLAKSVFIFFIIGLFIRLCLMPISMHIDLYSIYFNTYIAFDKSAPPVFQSFIITERVTGWINLGVIRIFSPLFTENIWDEYNPPFQNLTFNSEAQEHSWQYFLSLPHTNLRIFVMKLPALIFDLLCLFLIVLFFEDEKIRAKALKFWMINPAMIFSVYIFGKQDSIAIFFFIASMLLLKKRKVMLSSGLFVLAIFARLYFLMLLPFYVIYLIKKTTKEFVVAISVMTIFSICIIYIHQTLPSFMHIYRTIRMFLIMFIPSIDIIPGISRISPFIIAYFAIIIYAAVRMLSTKEEGMLAMWKYMASAFLLYFSTCYFHPQFLVGLSPIALLAIGGGKIGTNFLNLHKWQLIAAVPVTFRWGKDMFARFFASLSPERMMAFPSPADFISSFLDIGLFLAITWSIFGVITFFMLIKTISSKASGDF